jgi:membrane associated rhomboid family serine protease
MFNQPLTDVTKHLILINVLMFFGTYILLGAESYDLTEGGYYALGRLKLAAFMPGSANFQPFQLATHMFMHGNFNHLLFNMLSLFLFGPAVEMIWGPKRFLLYYLACGVGSYALHFGVNWFTFHNQGFDPTTYGGSMLGASGAIFGIYVAFGYLLPNKMMQLMFPPISLKAKYFVMLFAASELIFGVSGYKSGVAHFAHLGGALCGFLLIMYWYRFRFLK